MSAAKKFEVGKYYWYKYNEKGSEWALRQKCVYVGESYAILEPENAKNSPNIITSTSWTTYQEVKHPTTHTRYVHWFENTTPGAIKGIQAVISEIPWNSYVQLFAQYHNIKHYKSQKVGLTTF